MKQCVRFILPSLVATVLALPAFGQIATHVVIGEMYGGGGNSGSYWKQDFVELYNPTNSAVTMTNWSIQYQSATGSGAFSLVGTFSGTIASHSFFLIRCSQGSGGTADIPTPDADLPSITIGGSAGKIALVRSATPIEFPTDSLVVDFIGFGSTANKYEGSGPTANLGNTVSAHRKAQSTSTNASMGSGGADSLAGNGWDTDNNSGDYIVAYPWPQNSSFAAENPPTVGNSAPIISSMLRGRFVAEVGGVDSVTATIVDIDGVVAAARLHVRVNGGSDDSTFTMSNTGGSSYTAVIPAGKHTTAGALVEYFISAVDDSNAYASTATAPGGYFVGNAPISSIKAQTLAGVIGYGARINGMLGCATNLYSNGQGFIQDATGGLQMFQVGGLPALKAGRNVKVQGTIISFNNAYELSTPDFAFVDTTLGSGTVTPVTITLPVSQLATYANEGKVVKIAGMSTDSTGVFAVAKNYIYREGDLDTISVRVESNGAANNLVGVAIPGTPVDVIGVLSFSNGFQRVKPRSAQDMGYPAGDGTGTAAITPFFRFTSQSALVETLTVTGDGLNTLEGVSVTIPLGWTWDGTTLALAGTGFAGAVSAVTGDGTSTPYTITVSNASVTGAATGRIIISNLTSPSTVGLTTWTTKTRESGGSLTNIASQPTVNVVSGFEAVLSGPWSSTSTWSSGSVPLATDDVTFSTPGVTVTVDIPNAVCNNLTMTGSGTGSNSGPMLQFQATGTPQLTVNGSLSISGGSGGGGGDRGGRPKLTSNGNSGAVLIVKKTLSTTSSNSTANGDAGMNMNEGTVKLTGTTTDSIRNGAGLRLGNLQIGDGSGVKTVLTVPTTSATLTLRSLTVKQGSTLWIGTGSSTNTLTIGNSSTPGVPTLNGGIVVETGAALKVQESTAGLVVANLNLDGGGVTNNGTIDLASPATELTGCSYTLRVGGHPAGTSGVTQTIAGTAVGEYADVVIDSAHTLSLNQDMTIASGHVLTIHNGTLDENAGNTVIGAATATRTLAQSVSENFGGLGLEINAAGGAPGATVVSRRTGVPVTSGSSQSILRWFDIAPANNTGLNATMNFYYDTSELNGNNANVLKLYKSTDAGSNWSDQGGTPNPGLGRVELAGVQSFSRWTAADTANPLGASTLNVAYTAGWNMVSNPVVTANDSVTDIFPASSFGYAFAFVPGAGYQQRYTLAHGVGYWTKFAAPGSTSLSDPPRTVDTVTVAAGWNMIGSIGSAVDTATIVANPVGIRASQYFAYSAGYLPTATIVPGKGYWVKANAPGTLLMSAGAAADRRESVDPLSEFGRITIMDAAGASQTLYLGEDHDGTFPVSLYEMPPAGPDGTFDVRYAAGRMVETFPSLSDRNSSHAIDLRGTAWPVTVIWDLPVAAGRNFRINAGAGEKQIASSGRMVLGNPAVRRLTISTSGANVPAEFSLGQNYPNPFNPTTTLRFGLPVESRVTVRVYNLLGQQVAQLAGGVMAAGYHDVSWEGRTDAGLSVGSGVYFCRIEAAAIDGGRSFTDVRKMMLVR